MSNKANIERLKIDRFMISSNQVTSYLQNQLGFPIGADYTRWTGVTGNHSYVRMRVGIANKDIVASQSAPTNYTERILHEYGSGSHFKDTAMNVLIPFMYPKNFNMIVTDSAKLNEMAKYGLYGDRLNEVMKFSQLAYVQDQQMWRVYLRADRIIRDMLSDTVTGEVPGKLAITGVFGTESDTIRWEVEVSNETMANTELGTVSIDRLFAI